MWQELFKKPANSTPLQPQPVKPEDPAAGEKKIKKEDPSIFNNDHSYNKAVSLDYFVEESTDDPV